MRTECTLVSYTISATPSLRTPYMIRGSKEDERSREMSKKEVIDKFNDNSINGFVLLRVLFKFDNNACTVIDVLLFFFRSISDRF